MENTQSIHKSVIDSFEDITGLHREDIVLSANLSNDLGMDSLDLLEVIMDLEGSFNIVIPDEYWDDAKTVEDIVNLIIKMT